jgi:GTP-binding protein
LTLYSEDLAAKPEIVALNKIDALTDEEMHEKCDALAAVAGKVHLVSGATGQGVQPLLHVLMDLTRAPAEPSPEPSGEEDDPEGWTP